VTDARPGRIGGAATPPAPPQPVVDRFREEVPMRRLRAASLAALALVLAACARPGRPIGPSPAAEPRPPADPATVQVTNYNWATMNVFAVVRGLSQWLGQVETGDTETWELPAAAATLGEVELLADPVGSDARYQTGRIMVIPGTVIELTVENNLALSSYFVGGAAAPVSLP
jgi:hypothetical protein